MKTLKLLILTLSLTLCGMHFTYSQGCSPNPMYADSSGGVYPPPITDENPEGGIDRPACIQEYYEYTLTVIIPDSVEFTLGGTTLKLNVISAEIETEGAIEGLPPGIEYLCLPGNCKMPSNTSGCLLLYGTVPEGTSIGKYDLFIQLFITLEGLGKQLFEFPGSQFPGEYYLEVLQEGDSKCLSTSTPAAANTGISIYPTQLSTGQSIHFQSSEEKIRELYLFDAQGREMTHSSDALDKQQLSIPQNYAPGMYYLILKTEQGIVRKRVMVH